MDIREPIFIVGAGRSGSTVVQSMLAQHPHLAWLTILGKRFPHKPAWHRTLLDAIDSPIIGSYLGQRMKPSEVFDYWDYYSKGFRRTCRNLTAEDVTPLIRTQVRRALSELLTRRRSRLVAKATGWSRIGYLHGIFPDAKFIHVLRDGRAVANSFMNVDWWLGWQGPQSWRYGELPADLAAEWEQSGRSFVALAAIQWKIIIKSVEEGRPHVPDQNFFELRYEELCSDPAGVMKRVAAFAGLEWTEGFSRSVAATSLRSMNDRWKTELSPAQQHVLESSLAATLDKYGYRASERQAAQSGMAR